jgi:cytochrome P450
MPTTSAGRAIPGPRHPTALQNLRWVTRPLAYLRECHRRYGDVFTLRLENLGTWVFVASPEGIKQVLTGDPEQVRAGEAAAFIAPVMGPHSVMTLDGAAHMEKRRLLLPAFHGRRIQAHMDALRTIAAREVASWPRGRPIELHPRMQRLTIEVTLRVLLGIDVVGPREERLFNAVVSMVNWLCDYRRLFLASLVGPETAVKILRFHRIRGPVDRMLLELIDERRRDPNIDERNDVLSSLLSVRREDGTGMSDLEVRDQLMTLIIAGYETTATELSWTLERLAHDAARQERLRAEVSDDGNQEKPYLDAVIWETLRLRPVVPMVLRRLRTPMQVGGYDMPPQTMIAPSGYLLHRRPDIYPDPENWLPERWEGKRPGTYTWIPFGGGVRRCLGGSFATMQMRLVLEQITRAVSLESTVPGPGELPMRRANIFVPNRRTQVVVRDVAKVAA